MASSKKYQIQSKVMRYAHQIKAQFQSWGAAISAAWKVCKIRAKLIKGDYSFKFLKKSGEIREALGTLKADQITYTYKGSSKVGKWNIVKYFDLEKNAFRSFDIKNLI